MSKAVRHRWIRKTVAATAAGALALSLAACGSSGSTSAESGAASSGAPTSNAAASSGAASSNAASGSQAASPSAAASSSEESQTPQDSNDKATLTVYSGQHESFAQALADGFTKATGIKITLRSGDDAELANQIVEEGAGSPADVYMTEEPGPVAMVAAKGLTSPIDPAALKEVDQRLLPSTGNWLPYAARSRVLFYNPKLIQESALPASIMDLTQPQWKGKFAYAPSGAFTATVSYLIDTIGADKTEAWLKGIKANGINEQSNGKVRDSVEAGQHAFGLSNHYYWYILAAQKGGEDKLASRVHFFDHADAGSLLLTSGAAVLKSSKHQAEAQEFVKWLGATDGGQQIVADGDAFQFPVAPGVNSKADIPPLADLKFPTVDPTIYADTTQAQALIIKAGIA